MQLTGNRAGSLLPQQAQVPAFHTSLASALLHRIELPDVSQHRAHARRIGIARLKRMPPGVRPTADFDQAGLRLQKERVIGWIGIQL